MKSYYKIVFTLIVLTFSMSGFAQKVAHISLTDLIQAMPETATANKDLEALGKGFGEELETMEVELRNKLVTYENNRATWTEAVSSEKLTEMQALSEKLDVRRAEVEREFQNKQDEMLAPIFEKAKNAIDKVAKENGVTCVYDARMLLFADEAKGLDLFLLVKKELGIQ